MTGVSPSQPRKAMATELLMVLALLPFAMVAFGLFCAIILNDGAVR
jgi:hypothetical protein